MVNPLVRLAGTMAPQFAAATARVAVTNAAQTAGKTAQVVGRQGLGFTKELGKSFIEGQIQDTMKGKNTELKQLTMLGFNTMSSFTKDLGRLNSNSIAMGQDYSTLNPFG